VEIIEVVKKHFEDVDIIWDLSPLQVKGPKSSKKAYFAEFILTKGLNDKQKLILAAVLLSYTYPTFYYSLINSLPSQKDDAFGCHNDLNTGTTYPTIQTLLFILYGYDFDSYLTGWHELFNDRLFKMGVIETSPLSGLVIKNNPLNHVVSIGDDYLQYFFTGEYGTPKFSASFPAQKITTKLNWNDLVLDGVTLQQIKEITLWHKHRDVVLNQWNLHKMLSPGYKVLFHGPPGTGKTLTAAIMGQELGIDVFRIDLSMVVSKYIGETEKNLSTLFDRAMNKNWILFFDEADALFGSRTEVRDSHDRYANQEVSYLLQRVENYNGIIILASNLKGNMDRAFSRRFQSMIKFKIPDAEQRRRLWVNSFSQATVLENGFPLHDLAKTYELAGGSIINVVQYASLKAAERGDNIILYNDVKTGVIRELSKEGKTP
jgi:hypothetical protein